MGESSKLNGFMHAILTVYVYIDTWTVYMCHNHTYIFPG